MNLVLVDVAIGLCLFFFLLSIAASALTEVVMRAAALRQKFLKEAIEHLVPDVKTLKEFYAHPRIQAVIPGALGTRPGAYGLGRWNRPKAIPSEAFAVALIDAIASAKPSEPDEDNCHDSEVPAANRPENSASAIVI